MPNLLEISRETYGAAPALMVVNVVQVVLLAWVVRERVRAALVRRDAAAAATLRALAADQAGVFRRKVRPVVTAMMFLGPGIGLAMSTLLGALGMSALGDAMSGSGGQEALMAQMASAYHEISTAYLLMVAGSPPMLLGPIIGLLGQPLEDADAEERGGEPEDLLLASLEQLRTAVEAQSLQQREDARALRALLRAAETRADDAPSRRGDDPHAWVAP